MPIFVDSTELREGSPVTLTDPIVVDNLEELTGADIMLSLLNVPATTPKLIEMHVQNNAIFVQRKSGMDLVASMGERMNSSLSRMQKYPVKAPQCVLLFLGVLTANSLGQAKVNRHESQTPFLNVQSAISKWHDRGGVYENLPQDYMLDRWCEMKLKHLQDYKDNPEKECLASPPTVTFMDDMLQQVRVVNDGRVMLACLPGIGQKTANTLWAEFDCNLAEALCWLTMEKTERKIAGIGRKTKQNVKEYLGLEGIMSMGIEPDEEMIKELEKKK